VHVTGQVLDQAGIDYYPAYGNGAGWTLYENDALKATGWKPTPAELWLPRLLEADSEPELRAWYHTRLQEIALAHHIKRRSAHTPRFGFVPAQAMMPTPSLNETSAGTFDANAARRWRDRVVGQTDGVAPLPDFYRDFAGRIVSGIGVGTWMGDLSVQTDQRYVETLVHAAARGLNVFDTAINYRQMKAERCVGQAVRRLVQLGIPRQALLICSKGGYITHDADDRRPPEVYLRECFLEPGLIDAAELARHHCLRPDFINQQIDQSLNNLNLSCIDLYYLHNPEDEIVHLGIDGFYQQLGETFVVLEQAVQAGKIGGYGLATWHGTRVTEQDPGHLSLERAIRLAKTAAQSIGNPSHHLQALQLPYNVRDHQAYALATQRVGKQMLTPLAAARALGLYCFTSASVLQGAGVPAALTGLLPGFTPHSAALGAVVATPGVGTALVGMRSPTRVEEAIALAAKTPVDLGRLTEVMHG
jgi:aryl-alcohol dehydrogenase-like predicted oxidoreductase